MLLLLMRVKKIMKIINNYLFQYYYIFFNLKKKNIFLLNFSKINIFNKRNYKMGDPDNTNFDIDLSKIDINNINELISDEELKKIINEVEDIEKLELKKEREEKKTIEQKIKSPENLKKTENSTNIKKENNIKSEKNEKIIINNNKIKKKEILNPLEYINKYELRNYENNNISSERNFILTEYKKISNLQYNVMKFSKKQKLFYRIKKDKSKITCLYSRNGIIFSGNDKGIIKTFSSEKEYEYKTYISQELQNIVNMDKSVFSIDCSPNNDIFFSGHGNGFIILWDILAVNVKKIISNAHDNIVLEIKFVKFSNNTFYSILSSDINGKVNLINISQGYFLTNVNIFLVVNKSSPSYLIRTSYFSEEEKKNYNIYDESDNTLCVVGNEESIELFIIDPSNQSKKKMIKSILVLSNPNYKIDDNLVKYPDASFGGGYTPYFVDKGMYNKESFNSTLDNSIIINNNNNNNNNNNDVVDNNGLNFSKTQILLALSWFCKITVYAIPIVNKKIEFPMLIGYYINKIPIMRISFFSNSIIFFFDEEKKIKTINTNSLSKEEILKEDNSEGYLIDKNIESNFTPKNSEKFYNIISKEYIYILFK